jgi:hypothetical protein
MLRVITSSNFRWTGRVMSNRFAGYNSSIVGCCTPLRVQAGRLRLPSTDEVDVFSLPNPSSRSMELGSTKPLTEMSTRNFPGG